MHSSHTGSHALPALVALLLASAFALPGCQSTSGHKTPPATITRGPDGFSIEENVRVGLGVRSRFDEATQAIDDEQLERGIEILEQLVAESPEFAAAHINLAIARQRSDDLPAAEASLLRALEANPKHPVALNELGIVLRRSGRFAEARARFEEALSLQREFHFARKNLAVLCDLYLEDLACALEHYRLYLETNPEDETAEIWIADLERRNSAGGE